MIDDTAKEFIKSHRNDDPRSLALQAKRYPDMDMREVAVQVEGWQVAKEKLPEWAAIDGIIYPPKISMEQCSGEVAAKYKATLVSGGSLADLTGGFGIDFSYMARNMKRATYIERNGNLCSIARNNFPLLGLAHAVVVNGNSEELLSSMERQDWIYIDPARRSDAGGKVVALADCEPDVSAMEDALLSKAGKVLVKCSPMLDISLACRQLKNVEAVHVVAVNNECKELLIVLGGRGADIPVHCVDIRNGDVSKFVYTMQEEQQNSCFYANEVRQYLYEPCSAIQKAGCHNTLSSRLGLSKLHSNSQLYTSDTLIRSFPGRAFKVIDVAGFSKNDIKRVRSLRKANIAVRNFPDSVQQLRKRLKLADGGDVYIFATTFGKEEKALVICKKPE